MPVALTAAVKELYHHQCKDNYHDHREVKLMSSTDLEAVINRIIDELYRGDILPGDVDQVLYDLTSAELFAAVESGFGVSTEMATGADKEMLRKLKENVQVFSGFKNYQMLRAATDLLVDKDNVKRTFAQFREEVLKLHKDYNINFLKSEYNHATASSRMASKWMDFATNASTLPYLQYITAGDQRVRQSHKPLDKVILPVGHELWDTYMPPNDWGCRCTVRQLAEGTISKLENEKLPQLKVQFKTNTGKEGTVFPKTHPYYNVAEEHRNRASTNFGLN